MTPDPALDWDQLQTLFVRAADLDGSARDAFLREHCDDAALEREIRALLGTPLDPLFDGLAVDALDLGDGDAGQTVGPYRLIRRVGVGGMGEVWLADRADGAFRQRVAVKLVKRGMDSEAVLARFDAERQILADLDHPGVARLLGGGLAPDGRPYVAMEYVDGEPITAYADRQRLGIDARLALVERVAEAVAYAHQNLVVHRDLKPSNLLVSDSGGVKLLDFGIAKVLRGDDDPLLTLTEVGARAMTPATAAPEQVDGRRVTTATDVYGLGTVLYELLCGHRAVETAGRTLPEIETAVCHTVPPLVSVAAGTARTVHALDGAQVVTPDAIAQARGTTPDRLAQRLGGDLDTIVAKALRKEPDRRYANAAEFLDDLRRHRQSLPVLARRDTAGYRVGRFVRRHRAGVAAAVAGVAVLASVVSVAFARVGAERDLARTEAAKAQEVSAFLAGLFESVDPAIARGDEVTARDLLARGADRVQAELAGQPAVQAVMLGTIGRAYRSLGELGRADTLLTRSLSAFEALGTDALATARAQVALADLRTAQAAFPSADSLLALALPVQRAAFGDQPHTDLAATLDARGTLERERGDYAASEAPLVEALALRESLTPGDHEATADLLADLGETYGELGRYPEAEARQAASLAMRRRLHGDLHPGVAQSLVRSAALYRLQRDFARSEDFILEAVALDSILVGADHPMMAQALFEYASLRLDQSRFSQADALFDRVMEVQQAALGADHPYLAHTLNQLGEVRSRSGDGPGSLPYHRRALALQQRVLAPEHPDIAVTLDRLGQKLHRVGEYAESEHRIRQALAIQQTLFAPDHPELLSVRNSLSRTLIATGRMDEAIVIIRDVLGKRAQARGDDHPFTARSYYNLAAALRQQGTPASLAEAREVAAETVARYRAVFAPDSRELGFALMEQADGFLARGEWAQAAQAYREALPAFQASLGPDHASTQRVARELAALERGR